MDWKWTVTAVLPVLTLVLGAFLNQLSEGRREAAALKREVQLRQFDRERAVIERRETFELTHLVEINDLLSQLFTAALRCYHLNLDNEPHPEATRQLFAVNREITRVQGLIIDDVIRDLVETAHERANQLSRSSGSQYTEEPLTYATIVAAQEAIAARLRDIYRTGAH